MKHYRDVRVAAEGDLDPVLVYRHVVNVDRDVGGGLDDVHHDVHLALDGEVVRDNEGDEIHFVSKTLHSVPECGFEVLKT